MKKLVRLIGLLMALVAFMPFVFAISAHACEIAVTNDNIPDRNTLTSEKIKEIIVEVENEEETFNYPVDPNYRYTFIWSEPAKTRAVCYVCHYSTMSTVTRKSQYGSDYKECPYIFGAGGNNDLFNTWDYYKSEKCTHCGYQSDEWYDRRSYTACCGNNETFYNPEWVVVEDYNPAEHDIHQSLNWWLYKIR